MLLNRHRKTTIREWELSRPELESRDKNLVGNILHIFDFVPNYTFWYIYYVPPMNGTVRICKASPVWGVELYIAAVQKLMGIRTKNGMPFQSR